jgi:hypothetical protein
VLFKVVGLVWGIGNLVGKTSLMQGGCTLTCDKVRTRDVKFDVKFDSCPAN